MKTDAKMKNEIMEELEVHVIDGQLWPDAQVADSVARTLAWHVWVTLRVKSRSQATYAHGTNAEKLQRLLGMPQALPT